MSAQEYVRWFREIRLEDVPLVGGKNASLGELYSTLASEGIRVPNGFALTAQSYRDALAGADAAGKLHRLLDGLDKTEVDALAKRAAEARQIVYDATGGDALREQIVASYRDLEKEYGSGVAVAVRSSATAEDLPTASFAGQHESFLNIRGETDLFEACRRCFASIFTDRAIVYRIDNGFDHFKVALSVGVMKMVRSDLAASGVIFTLDTESGFRDVVFITGVLWPRREHRSGPGRSGRVLCPQADLQEGIPGHSSPLARQEAGANDLCRWPHRRDHADRRDFRGRSRAILPRRRGGAEPRRLRHQDRGPLLEQGRPCRRRWTSNGRRTARTAGSISSRRGPRPSPRSDPPRRSRLTPSTEPAECSSAAARWARRSLPGTVRVVADISGLAAFRPGEVLVAETTSPDWEPVMKTAAAIVTNRGGRTCHAAIVARELGVPAVVGAEGATQTLKAGATVTVSCAEGDIGSVYEGRIPFETDAHRHSDAQAAAHGDHGESGQPRSRLPRRRCCRTTASGWRAWSSSSASTSASIRWRWRSPEKVTSAEDRETVAKLVAAIPPSCRFLHREAVGRRRHDRRGVLSEAGDRPPVRFQDQRICQADRRRRLRAEGRQPDARLPRRLALRASCLCRGLRAGMRGAKARARRDGPAPISASWCRSAAASRKAAA